ncbi:MAG: YraN family protein [Crocinitomicaceae bacterium]|nr:YraN family protein [Crocinitomicaceae bacterium]
MAEHNALGIKGEKLAKEFLTNKGYDIIESNYRFKHLEIDLIAYDKDELVIIEVKTRANDFMADAHDTVSQQKQKHLVKAANAYIEEKNLDVETRFDIVSVLIQGHECSVEHIEDAFYPVL